MGAVTVTVRDPQGFPLPGAHVELFVLQPNWKLTDEKNTDSNGIAVLDPHLIFCLIESYKVVVTYRGVTQEQNSHLDFWSCDGRMTFVMPPPPCGPSNPCPPCSDCVGDICVEIPNCCYPPCPPPQYCVGHTCVSPTPCNGVGCEPGYDCVNGVCVPSRGNTGLFILIAAVGVIGAAAYYGYGRR